MSVVTRDVAGLQFGLMNPQEVARGSVCEVKYHTLYEKRTNQEVPQPNGLMDSRMGASTRQILCKTCGEDWKECPGHFGHLIMAMPMYNILYLRETIDALRCVCVGCSRLLVPVDVPTDDTDILAPTNATKMQRIQEQPRQKILRAVALLCKKTKACTHCHVEQPAWAWVQGELRLESHDSVCTHQILSRISDDDIRAMGFSPTQSRPSWLMFTVMPVPPPCIRPGGTKKMGENDLTLKLVQIVRYNLALRDAIRKQSPGHIIRDIQRQVQNNVATYIKNDTKLVPQDKKRDGSPMTSLDMRLKGKTGRLRQTLMGKRVDFCGRSVITPDPNLALNEVGVPLSVALILTYPETVTARNRAQLMELVVTGPDEHPGARFIVRENGDRVDLKTTRYRSRIYLEDGMVVERHIRNGDWVVFNRQPSLHRMSMMGHRVRVLPYSTFRMNLSTTSPYNADFDGDEMNLHVPQSYDTVIETSELLAVEQNIVSSQKNAPVMGIVQDSLFACRELTAPWTFITRADIMQLVMWIDGWNGILPAPAIQKPQPLWTGKQLFSMVLPDTVNLHGCGVHIIQGQLVDGMITKRAVGSSASGGLIHRVWLDYGPQVTMYMINNIQHVCNNWLMIHGHSVGIQDCITDQKTNEAVTHAIEKAKIEVQRTVVDAQYGRLDKQPGKTMHESFEASVNTVLNNARDTIGKLVERTIEESNRIGKMVAAGSKGSNINLSQIMGLVGQQNVMGGRISNGFRGRTLPHFTRDDYGPEARGFVQNSYLRGLTPQEFYFHAMAGREGIIDTACKTSESGYLRRKLNKMMESVMTHYDGTVRDGHGGMIQFRYGDDNIDPTFVESQIWDIVEMDQEEFRRRHHHDCESMQQDYGRGWLSEQVRDEIFADISISGHCDLLADEWVKLEEDWRWVRQEDCPVENFLPNVCLPVNLRSLILSAQQSFDVLQLTTTLDPREVVRKTRDFFTKSKVVPLFQRFFRCTLSSRRCIEEYRLSPNAFEWLIAEAAVRYERARITPGTMVGAIAAECISEPATQMTLNSKCRHEYIL